MTEAGGVGRDVPGAPYGALRVERWVLGMSGVWVREVGAHGYLSELSALLEMMPCEAMVLDGELAVAGFNKAASVFFRNVCTLRTGMQFDELSGALWDMAEDGGFGEIELLTQQIREFEVCTVDYRRFDKKHYRISTKPSPYQGVWTAVVITDISDITESERFLTARVKELSDERGTLRSRLELADTMISERESVRLGREFAGRLSAVLDSFEEALKNGNTVMGLKELEKQREYIKHFYSESDDRAGFIQRLQKSLTPRVDSVVPKVNFHHISLSGQSELPESDIIEASREGVMLIALYGAVDSIGVSLRTYEGGFELNVHTDGPVVPDFERTEQYKRLKKIARRMRAGLEVDAANGLSLRLSCIFIEKSVLSTALVALADASFTSNVCRTLGGGSEPMMRCIAASAGIDFIKACKEYAPDLLIAEADKIVNLAAKLKRLYSKMKIIAVFRPDGSAQGTVQSSFDGFLSQDISDEGLCAAVGGVMNGLVVQTGAATVSNTEAAVSRFGLTEIERSIISLTGQGVSSDKIAAALHYSQGSLRNMLSAIYEKLGISDRAQLTAFAILNGFSESFQGWGVGS